MIPGSNQPILTEADEVRLWEYIDGLSNFEEQTAIEKQLGENAAWKAKYQELLETHQSLQLIELDHPSMRFTRNVMEEISRTQIAPATKKYINNRIIGGIGLFFLLMLAGLIVYGIGQINWAEASDSKKALGIDLNKVDYSKMFDNTFVNVFMMLNVVLGLTLLDRVLNNKRKNLEQGI